MKEKVIRPVSSQLAYFLRLGPTPASSDEVGCSAVNRRVASSNLARGAKSSCSYRLKIHQGFGQRPKDAQRNSHPFEEFLYYNESMASVSVRHLSLGWTLAMKHFCQESRETSSAQSAGWRSIAAYGAWR